MTGYPSRADDAVAVRIRVAAAEAPRSHRYFSARGDCGDLVFRANNSYFGFERLKQCAGGDLRADPARVTECDGESRT
jgi:hypothetical protein